MVNFGRQPFVSRPVFAIIEDEQQAEDTACAQVMADEARDGLLLSIIRRKGAGIREYICTP